MNFARLYVSIDADYRPMKRVSERVSGRGAPISGPSPPSTALAIRLLADHPVLGCGANYNGPSMHWLL